MTLQDYGTKCAATACAGRLARRCHIVTAGTTTAAAAMITLRRET